MMPTARTFVVTLMLVSGSAASQEAERPLLSGPEVEDSRPGLVEDSFGEMATGKARLGAMAAIPAQDLRKIMQGMNKEDAPAEIRLSQEQNERVRELMAEYSRERRAWMVENKDELAELRKAAGMPEPVTREGGGQRGERGQREGDAPRRGKPESAERNMMEPVEATGARRAPAARTPAPAGEGGGGGDRGRAVKTPEQEAAGLRLREFMAKGPTTGDLQRRIYAELSPKQQKFVDDEVRRMADERGDQREMEKIKRRQEDREAKGEQAGGSERPGRAGGGGRIDWDAVLPADGSVNLDALPERARARLESLSEDEQRRAIEAFRKRMEKQQGGRGD